MTTTMADGGRRSGIGDDRYDFDLHDLPFEMSGNLPRTWKLHFQIVFQIERRRGWMAKVLLFVLRYGRGNKPWLRVRGKVRADIVRHCG